MDSYMPHDPLWVARFWSQVEGGGTAECWIWRGRANHRGYGRTAGTMAHRIAYKLVKGDIPDGMLVRHVCDNPACCNPKHLLLGTHKENSCDAVERCRIAHSEGHGNTNLTAEDVLYIRQNPDRLSGRRLAEKFDVSASTISYIRSGRSWKWLVGVGGIEPPSPPCQGDA